MKLYPQPLFETVEQLVAHVRDMLNVYLMVKLKTVAGERWNKAAIDHWNSCYKNLVAASDQPGNDSQWTIELWNHPQQKRTQYRAQIIFNPSRSLWGIGRTYWIQYEIRELIVPEGNPASSWPRGRSHPLRKKKGTQEIFPFDLVKIKGRKVIRISATDQNPRVGEHIAVDIFEFLFLRSTTY